MAHPALLPLIFLVALLYSSVGHGGASGYLAALALCGFAPAEMKASALILNLLVAGIAFFNYWKAGHFNARLFWPFAAASIPLAFLGGLIQLPPRTYSLLLAAALAVAAWRLILPSGAPGSRSTPPSLPAAAATGGGIGLLSGLVGVGGGIFLSPLMILLGWADAKTTAGVSAAFIWVNSAAGLYGHLSQQGAQTLSLWPLAAAAGAGGLAGSYAGAKKLTAVWLRRLLGLVLLIAAFKLVRVAL
ncbi:MAG: sulfite exporter TauE/SafE family protein [Elusimicrobia bacterium]|nr:sulfite exporter TauE/SafE family protein [Elusimicrobiota bacterium]